MVNNHAMGIGVRFFSRLTAAMLAGVLAACTGVSEPPPQPSFYRSMAAPDAELDAGAAASMITGYRSNNGLGAVTLDSTLMKLANEQSHAMAKKDLFDH